MKSIRDVDVQGKRVLLRVDFNVPISDGTVSDDKRIRAALPTIEHLVNNGARVVLMSHLGRPSGKGYEEAYSVAPAARVLGRLLGTEVVVAPEVAGEKATKASQTLQNGQVMMVENLRFDPREKKNDPTLAQELAQLGDIYVNDAFGVAHRAHASVEAITKLLPSYAGFLLDSEVSTLQGVLDNPQHPFMAILGGAKVSDKIALVDKMLDIVDALIIGGGMCFTFLAAKGYETGKSLVENEWIERAGEMLAKAQKNGTEILLPVDVVVAPELREDAKTAIYSVEEIPQDMMGLDIGPATCEMFKQKIMGMNTIVWNGPMGVFEMKPFESGTKHVAEALAANEKASTIIGGGDSAAAVAKFNLESQMTFISTGGGASMQLLEGTPLPGVVALN